MDNVEQAIRERMRRINAPDLSVTAFLRHFRRLADGHRGLLDRNTIAPVDDVPEADTLGRFVPAGRAALKRALMIKLNGGLGTSMGLEKAKSLISVKNGRTFLDIAIGHVEAIRRETGVALPLMLMNSFMTDADTKAALRDRADPPLMLLQHRVPKLRQDSLLPVESPGDPQLEWCPPGHGDIYVALTTSGMLEQLIARGIEFAFVSNTDNLGATMDLSILGYLAESHIPFLMEVTERTPADRKGGHLARLRDGRLILRELAQCPDDEADDFQDIARYRYFNTNNLWINLPALRAQLEAAGGLLDLPLIVNRKPVNPADRASTPVYQLETAMGAAISVFKDAGAVLVPRARFSPVKTTDDLLALWSDAYVLTDDMRITLRPERQGRPVVVHLDKPFYAAYADFCARFPEGPPSLAQCESLTVKGDVRFGANVVCRGPVEVVNHGNGQIVVPAGAELVG